MIGAVVVAAGAGQRLGGKCKATLRIDDQTFLEKIILTGKSIGVEEWVVVTGPPHQSETLREVNRLGIQSIVNNNAIAGGMSSSVASGFNAMCQKSVDAAFLWPVDIPYVSKGTLKMLIEAYDNKGIVAPHHEGAAGHPPLIGNTIFQTLAQCAHIDGGARTVLRNAAPYLAIEVADRGILRDVDTLDDLP